MPLTPCILVGPTASGKSGLALWLAERLAGQVPIEIISIDSALVYRGMDIGTAKPNAAERAAVPHHGIDLIDPTQSYSAAQFVQDAHAAVADIQSRGAWPWLVGGTMLYVKALREGMDTLPPSDPAVRAQLEADTQRLGIAVLYQRLQQVDPVTAQRLQPGDTQRIQRALEVQMLTGEPLSRLQGQATHPRLEWPTLSLEPAQRGWLHERIAQRFDQMLAQGLVDEVHRLRSRGDLHTNLPSIRCVGYRQLWDARASGPLQPGSAAWQTVREQGIAATRQLAKRQLTWLRSMPIDTRLAADAADVADQLLALARHQRRSHG
jgi:tRNA dimethylallyltransferase